LTWFCLLEYNIIGLEDPVILLLVERIRKQQDTDEKRKRSLQQILIGARVSGESYRQTLNLAPVYSFYKQPN
jgi:hypothetical protein